MTVHPWQQRDNESAPAYEAFCAYRDMGADRSHELVGRKLSKSTALMSRWSRTHGWVERVAAWDHHVQQQRDKDRAKAESDIIENEKKARLAEREHRRQLMTAWKTNIAKVVKTANESKDAMPPKVLESFSKIMATYLDQSRKEWDDEPTRRTELTGKDGQPIETVDKTTDVRDELARLLDRLATRGKTSTSAE